MNSQTDHPLSPNQAKKTIKSINKLSKKLSSDNIEVNSFGAATFSRSDLINAATFMVFTIIALNMNLNSNAFIFYKLGIFLPIATSFILIKNFTRNEKIKFISISIFQLLSSSTAFGLLIPNKEGEELDINFHLNAEFDDLAFFAIWISIIFSFSKNSLAYIDYAKKLFIGLTIIKSIIIQIIIGTLVTKIIIYVIFYVLIIWTEFYFITDRLTKENESLKSSWEKASADLKEDLKKFEEEIENSYNDIISSFGASEADEILLKLRLLKFQLMIEENPVNNSSTRKLKKNDIVPKIFSSKNVSHSFSMTSFNPMNQEDKYQKVLIYTYY